MYRAVRYLIIPVLALTIGCNRDPQSQSQRLVDSGNRFYEKGKFKEANMQYRRAIQKYPKSTTAYYRLGLSALKLNDFSTAAQALRRALDTDPSNTDAATKLADIYWLAYASDQRKFKSILPEIEELSKNLLAKNPNSYDGLRLAGYLSLASQDLPTALAKFEKAAQTKPYQPELSMVMVQTLLASNRKEDAEKLARDFLSHEKKFAPMYDQLLLLHLSRNDVAGAEQVLKDKIENNPKTENFYLQLAGLYYGTKRLPEAETTLQRLLSNPKDFPLARLSVGRFFFRFRDFDRAWREYDAGLKANPKEKSAYQKAMVELLVAQGKATEARSVIEEVIKDQPKDAQAIEMRSALRLQTGNPQEVQAAINDLQALVTKTPDNPIYRFELARAMFAKGQTEQARSQLEEAIRLRPDFVPPKVLFAQILSGKNEHARALQVADDIIRVDQNNLTAHLIRSSALIGIGEREKAKTELEAILKAAPNSVDAKFQLGLLNFTEKNYKAADAIFRQMQETNPGDNRGLVGIVETQVAQKDFSGAIQTITSELQRDPNRQDFRLALANTLVRAEQFDAAIKEFQALVQKNPKSADLYVRLGETYRLKGDLNAAIDNFRKAAALAPNDVTSTVRLAMLLDGLGRRNEAKPLYEQILRVKPDEPVALNNLAYIKAEEGADLDQALSLAMRAKQALPQDPNIADTLGWVYIKKNLSEDAIKVFRELVTKQPKNATYRFHLAMALYQKGDRPSAKKECETALQSNPSKEEAGRIRELMQKLG